VVRNLVLLTPYSLLPTAHCILHTFFNSADGGIQLFECFRLGLRDVGQTLLLLHLLFQGFQRFQASGSQAGVTLSGCDVLVERGNVGVDLRKSLCPAS